MPKAPRNSRNIGGIQLPTGVVPGKAKYRPRDKALANLHFAYAQAMDYGRDPAYAQAMDYGRDPARRTENEALIARQRQQEAAQAMDYGRDQALRIKNEERIKKRKQEAADKLEQAIQAGAEASRQAQLARQAEATRQKQAETMALSRVLTRKSTNPTSKNYDASSEVILKIYYSKENINRRCGINPTAPMPTPWVTFIALLQSIYNRLLGAGGGAGGETVYVKPTSQETLDNLKKSLTDPDGIRLSDAYVKKSVREGDFILMYGHYASDTISSTKTGDISPKKFTMLAYQSMNIGRFGGLTYTNALGKMQRVTDMSGNEVLFGSVAGFLTEFTSYLFPYLMGEAAGIQADNPDFVGEVAKAYILDKHYVIDGPTLAFNAMAEIKYVSVLHAVRSSNTLATYLKIDYDVMHEIRETDDHLPIDLDNDPLYNFTTQKTNGSPGVFLDTDEIRLFESLIPRSNPLIKIDLPSADSIIATLNVAGSGIITSREITMVVNLDTFVGYIQDRTARYGTIYDFFRGFLNINLTPTSGTTGPFNKASLGPSANWKNFFKDMPGGRKPRSKKKSRRSKKLSNKNMNKSRKKRR